MDTEFFLFILVWGGWLSAPVMLDIVPNIFQFFYATRYFHHQNRPISLDGELPTVSVLVPVYNGQDSIDLCLSALKAQNYPAQLLEIFVIDDGSSDNTATIVQAHIDRTNPQHYLQTLNFLVEPHDFDGHIHFIRRTRGNGTKNGKAQALNNALPFATGSLILTIDDDSILHPNAILAAVAAFLEDPQLVAATSHLVIDPKLVTTTDTTGYAQVDEHNQIKNRPLTLLERILTAFEFFEYAWLSHMERPSSDASNRMFTMSGASAFYKRDLVIELGGFQGRTLGEDTDMTLTLHKIPNGRIGYIWNSHVHISPILSWNRLRSQRMRWYRASIESLSIHLESRPSHKRYFWYVFLPLYTMRNHTLLVPRLAWLAIVCVLPWFGYPWQTVLLMVGIIVLIYSGLYGLQYLFIYRQSTSFEKQLLFKFLPIISFQFFYKSYLYVVYIMSNIIFLNKPPRWYPD